MEKQIIQISQVQIDGYQFLAALTNNGEVWVFKWGTWEKLPSLPF